MGIATLPDWEPPKSGAFALNPHCVAARALGWVNNFLKSPNLAIP
ncbi:MAG: hypothetical protein V7K29_26870 [Nostoc sp.]